MTTKKGILRKNDRTVIFRESLRTLLTEDIYVEKELRKSILGVENRKSKGPEAEKSLVELKNLQKGHQEGDGRGLLVED